MKHTAPLKLEIVRQGLLIKDVSEKSGININYISMACNGRIRLKPQHEKNIADVLGCPVKKLFPEIYK